MSKFIIDIPDHMLEDGCQYCPLNYDDLTCRLYNSDFNDDDPLDLWCELGEPAERPPICPLKEYEE